MDLLEDLPHGNVRYVVRPREGEKSGRESFRMRANARVRGGVRSKHCLLFLLPKPVTQGLRHSALSSVGLSVYNT
jgi:hypothetical protein